MCNCAVFHTACRCTWSASKFPMQSLTARDAPQHVLNGMLEPANLGLQTVLPPPPPARQVPRDILRIRRGRSFPPGKIRRASAPDDVLPPAQWHVSHRSTSLCPIPDDVLMESGTSRDPREFIPAPPRSDQRHAQNMRPSSSVHKMRPSSSWSHVKLAKNKAPEMPEQNDKQLLHTIARLKAENKALNELTSQYSSQLDERDMEVAKLNKQHMQQSELIKRMTTKLSQTNNVTLGIQRLRSTMKAQLRCISWFNLQCN